MIASQKGEPIKRLFQEFMELVIDDIRYKRPTACPRNEYAEAKRSAEELLKTKFYGELCDWFGIPSKRAAKKILSEKNTLDKKKIDELP